MRKMIRSILFSGLVLGLSQFAEASTWCERHPDRCGHRMAMIGQFLTQKGRIAVEVLPHYPQVLLIGASAGARF